jgi:site-specific DNA recombinase
MRAAIYARISSDRSGDQAGVDRQIADCAVFAETRGWTVVGHFVDNDISAFSGRQRPQFEALLHAVRDRQVDVIVTYHVDRLYRRLRDLVPLLDLCEKTGATVATVKAGTLDLATASGRVVASILGAVAEGESARQAERIRRQKLERALAGKPNGSMRSFGFAADGTIVEVEAEVIRDIAARVLAGESLRSVANDLNARSVPTVKGGTWRQPSLRQMLMAARLSGQREHTPAAKGRGHSNGPIVAKGTWEAIISPEDTARLRQLLTDPARKTTRPGRQLLTGLLRCGNCGEGMNSHADTKGGRRYVCIRLPGTKKCGKRSIVGEQTDEFVMAAFVEALYAGGSPRRFFTPAPSGVPADAQAEADRLTKAIKQLAVRFANDQLTEDEFDRQQRALKDERQRRLQAATALSPTSALSRLPETREAFWELFPTLSVDRQRAVLAAAFARIELGPVSNRGHSTFNYTRLKFVWRDGVVQVEQRVR